MRTQLVIINFRHNFQLGSNILHCTQASNLPVNHQTLAFKMDEVISLRFYIIWTTMNPPCNPIGSILFDLVLALDS